MSFDERKAEWGQGEMVKSQMLFPIKNERKLWRAMIKRRRNVSLPST